MQIISSFMLMNGYKAPPAFNATSAYALMQPVQMIPYEQKNDQWRAWNMDWYERQGLDQIAVKEKRYSKNYRLANGVIDKADYNVDPTNEHADLLDTLTHQSDPSNALTELKFFPIAPLVVDMLVGEHLKTNRRVMAYAVDPISRNEKLDKKKELVDYVLQEEARVDLMQQMIAMGVDLESEEAQFQLSPEGIRSLPEVEEFMRKSYRGIVEEWANHQMNSDRQRFRMDELESIGFRDMVVNDEQCWEIRLHDDDYEPRVLDPRYTFGHKAPGTRYGHEGNFAGYVELLTVSDVVDTLGYKMSEEELLSLQRLQPIRTMNTLLAQNYDGNVYDVTKSLEENQKSGSPALKQYMAWEDAFGTADARNGTQLFDHLLSSDKASTLDRDLLRVTTVYWKSQKRVGFLTKISEDAEPVQTIVTEDYVVTDKPMYDTTFYSEKTADNLIWGEHIDWIWVNEVWGGIKVGPNSASMLQNTSTDGFQPIYLGVGSKRKPDRLPFQFRSESSLYGASLPIIYAKFTERGAPARSVVDRIAPFQVGYNMVNNMIADIVMDDLGTVIILDHNTLPRHSMGESWGKGNLARAYVAMKDYRILPVDTNPANTEGPVNFQNMQVLDASQTNRLLGLVQLANHFKMEALASIGITPERMGLVNAQQTATGTQMSVQNSYAPTERLFTQHADWFMPRVWEMMLSAAQYYHSKGDKRSIRLSYINDRGQDVLFQRDGIDLLPRMVNVHCTTTYAAKELKMKLEQLALENNTTDATIYDLGKMLTLDTPTEVLDALQAAEAKAERYRQEEYQNQQQLQEQMMQAQSEMRAMEQQFEAAESDKDRQLELLKAQIQAAGYSGQQDLNANAQNDYMDNLQFIQKQQEYQDQMNFKREQQAGNIQLSQQEMEIKRQELQTRKEIAEKQLQIARENKTAAELEKKRKKAEQAKKKKSK